MKLQAFLTTLLSTVSLCKGVGLSGVETVLEARQTSCHQRFKFYASCKDPNLGCKLVESPWQCKVARATKVQLFKSARREYNTYCGRNPRWKHLNEDKMKCDMVGLTLNARFEQHERSTCGPTAMAAAMSIYRTAELLPILTSLYYDGQANEEYAWIQPRSYVFDLDPAAFNETQMSASDQMWLTEWMWTFSLRDSRNVEILKAQEAKGLQPGSSFSYLPVQAFTELHLSHAVDMMEWCNRLFGGDCSIYFSDSEDMDIVIDSVKLMLPIDSRSLLYYIPPFLSALASGAPLPTCEECPKCECTDAFKHVLATVQAHPKALQTLLTPVSTGLIQSVCGLGDSIPVFLVVNAHLIYGDRGSPCKPGQFPCAPEHNLLLRGCDASRRLCYLWSYGQMYTVQCERVAQYTMQVVHPNPNSTNYVPSVPIPDPAPTENMVPKL